MADRQVRFDDTFFEELDAVLGDERGPNGEPARIDFLLHDLPPLRDLLAEDFEGATLRATPGSPYASLVATGTLFRSIALYCMLVADDVHVIGVALELWPPDID